MRSGCLAAQGSLFGAPMPVAELPGWLHRNGHLPGPPTDPAD